MTKLGGFQNAALSLLLLATAAFSCAQHADKRDSQVPQVNPAQRSDVQPSQSPQRVNSSQQDSPQQQQAVETQSASLTEISLVQPILDERRVHPVQQQNNWQQHGASHLVSLRQTWAQRGGYQGYRVPHADFIRSFGKNHSFHVFGLPYKEVGGQPRFQYGGYWFSMMEPYPEYWGSDWYRNDDMYVDYDGGGYYLYDRRYSNRPGVAISISF